MFQPPSYTRAAAAPRTTSTAAATPECLSFKTPTFLDALDAVATASGNEFDDSDLFIATRTMAQRLSVDEMDGLGLTSALDALLDRIRHSVDQGHCRAAPAAPAAPKAAAAAAATVASTPDHDTEMANSYSTGQSLPSLVEAVRFDGETRTQFVPRRQRGGTQRHSVKTRQRSLALPGSMRRILNPDGTLAAAIGDNGVRSGRSTSNVAAAGIFLKRGITDTVCVSQAGTRASRAVTTGALLLPGDFGGAGVSAGGEHGFLDKTPHEQDIGDHERAPMHSRTRSGLAPVSMLTSTRRHILALEHRDRVAKQVKSFTDINEVQPVSFPGMVRPAANRTKGTRKKSLRSRGLFHQLADVLRHGMSNSGDGAPKTVPVAEESSVRNAPPSESLDDSARERLWSLLHQLANPGEGGQNSDASSSDDDHDDDDDVHTDDMMGAAKSSDDKDANVFVSKHGPSAVSSTVNAIRTNASQISNPATLGALGSAVAAINQHSISALKR